MSTTPQATKISDHERLNGTGLVGYVRATREELELLFGTPNVCSEVLGPSGDNKVTTEWALEIVGHVFTLYDYKNGRAPQMDEVFDWHVGANGNEVLLALAIAYPGLSVAED